ncbi:MAG: hypothetical protein ABSF52_23185 [Syntrophobacteraceae bacterium]
MSILSVSLTSGASIAANSPQYIILYGLLPGSSFQEGCIPPCMCPVMMSEDVRGTFGLTAAGPGPIPLDSSQFNTYSLTGISWTVHDPAGKPVHTITGNGTYRFETVGNGVVRHQLTLNISIDGQAPVFLDSGLVLGCSQFRDIAVSVRLGSTCFETSMDIIAAPAH